MACEEKCKPRGGRTRERFASVTVNNDTLIFVQVNMQLRKNLTYESAVCMPIFPGRNMDISTSYTLVLGSGFESSGIFQPANRIQGRQ
jgi:hypothetical protein